MVESDVLTMASDFGRGVRGVVIKNNILRFARKGGGHRDGESDP